MKLAIVLSITLVGIGSAPAQHVQGHFVSTALANAKTGAKGGLFLVDALVGTVTDLKATGDLATAQEEQQRAVELVTVLIRFRALPAFKALMTMIGFDCGPTRLPVVPLDAGEVDALRSELEAIGFFDWGR